MALFSQVPGDLDIEIALNDECNLVLTFASGTFSADYSYDANLVKYQLETEVPIPVSGTGSYYDELTLYISQSHTDEVNKHNWYLECTANGASRRWLAGYFDVKKYPP